MNKKALRVLAVLYLVSTVVLVACGGGGGGGGNGNPPASTVAISGTVSSPNGVIAFRQPSAWKRFFAGLFASKVFAATPGMTPVGSGVTVNLIQIDNTGVQVGSVIAATTTDASGVFTLQAPAGFIPASNYVVQAMGAGAELRAFVTSTSVNVDPYTHATEVLITGSGASITSVRTVDIASVYQVVIESSSDVSTGSLTASQLTTALNSAVKNDIESSNVVASISSPGGITGTVADNSGVPLSGIMILVRTFGDQVSQAMTRTDASGIYTVRVPAGNYVIAAVNDTSTSTAASEWWTSNGGSTNHHSAGKVTVGTTIITKNFTLAPGGRINGKVTAESNGTALGGILITLTAFSSNENLLWMRTRTDGTYSLNAAPDDYIIIARNNTVQPYASEALNFTLNGSTIDDMAQKMSITPGATITADFSLLDGYKIEGTVSDPVTGPVDGVPVRFYDDATGAAVVSLRTWVNGGYRVWLRPGVYDVLTHGQTAVVDASGANKIQSFAAAVGKVTAMLQDSSNNPVSQAKARLYDSARNLISYEISNGDGAVTLFSTITVTNDLLEIRIDNGEAIGSSIYLNGTQLASGTPVTVATSSTTTIGTINLPAGAVLTGTVTKNKQPAPNVIVQIRSGGTSGSNRFVQTRTMIDGSYTISLPAGTTFDRVCAFDVNTTCPSGSINGATYAFSDNVLMGAEGSTNTLNFAY